MNITYIYGDDSVGCQGNSSRYLSEWGRGIEKLAVAFEAMSKGGGAQTSARGEFYGQYWNLSLSAAKSRMKGIGWQGDVHHDAEDIASEVLRVLVRQEARAAGVFGEVPRTPEQLRGYLSRSIWEGSRQRIQDLTKKRRIETMPFYLMSEDQAEFMDQSASEPWKKMALEDAIATMQKDQRGRYRKLPAGVTPIDCVLDVAMGKALVSEVPLRTLQRYMEDSRRELAGRLGWTLAAKARTKRKAPRHEEPEM